MAADAASSDPDPLVLTAGEACLTVSPVDGGRMTSLIVRGQELLVTEGYGPIRWGCYPMVPYAGRIRDGRFTFDGRTFQLPCNLPPHAIHGTVFERAWTVASRDTIQIDLGPSWPFPGHAIQRFDLGPGGLTVSLTLAADVAMPATLGWHPWFRRVLTGTSLAPRPSSAPVTLRFEPDRMYARDADGLPTGELVEPQPPPWDDCFVGLRSTPRLTWPGRLALEIESSCDHWVVYDEAAEGVCVEPQTGPPDAANIAPRIVTPERPLSESMSLRWWPDRQDAG